MLSFLVNSPLIRMSLTYIIHYLFLYIKKDGVDPLDGFRYANGYLCIHPVDCYTCADVIHCLFCVIFKFRVLITLSCPEPKTEITHSNTQRHGYLKRSANMCVLDWQWFNYLRKKYTKFTVFLFLKLSDLSLISVLTHTEYIAYRLRNTPSFDSHKKALLGAQKLHYKRANHGKEQPWKTKVLGNRWLSQFPIIFTF